MVNLKNEFYKSKVSPKSGSKTHLLAVTTILEMQ
jgi:hypothetical protein